ncbi:TetR/AcrR family transcriptional regulator [Rhodococcus sp. NPDC055112]
METSGGPELPRKIKLAWGLAEPGSRGPRRGLSLEQILDAAIELADSEGVAALSMSRVAKALGFTTMSLYRYVESKDELIELISDRALGPPPEFAQGLGWREGLQQWAIAEREGVLRHPWWLQLPIVAPPTGPNNMRWLDAGLARLSETPLPEALRVKVVLNTSLYVVGRARFSNDIAVAAAAEDGEYASILPALLDPDRFPHLLRAVSEGAFEDDPRDEDLGWADADFRFALDLLLDGIEKLVDAHR